MDSTLLASREHSHGIFQRIGSLCEKLKERGLMMGGAESCTGGLVAACCTEVAGSSDWFAGSIVSYADSVKEGVLAVPGTMIQAHGAVSEPVVRAMARAALGVLGVDVAFALSGVAGPGGGSPEKPVGTVWIATACRAGGEARIRAERFVFPGGRTDIRLAACAKALEMVEQALG